MPAAVFLNPCEKVFCVGLAVLKEKGIGLKLDQRLFDPGRNSQVKDTGML